MNQFRLKLEHLLYAAAFLLALVVRFARIDSMPLSDLEASLALQALELAKGQQPVLAPHPLYLALTTLLMFLFTPSNATARFWPALAGSFLVLLPLLFRGERAGSGPTQRFQLGRLSALLLSFFLALDPGLVAVSKQAGGLSLALFFTLLALGLWVNRRVELAGVSAGLAVLSGPGFWPGLIGLTAAVFLAGIPARSSADISDIPSGDEPSGTQDQQNISWRRGVVFALAAVFFAGTLFFAIPGGLGAMAGSIPAYLSGWLPSTGGAVYASIGQIFAALLLYEFLPLILGLWGAVRGLLRRNAFDQFLLVWWVVAFGLVLAYPAHQAADLVWSLIPLWLLAARQMTRLASVPSVDRLTSLSQAVLTALIVAFISMTFVSLINTAPATLWEYWVRLAGAALMLVASTGLIAWGWSREVALRGLAWGICAVLVIYTTAAVWNAAGLSGRASHELWSGSSLVRQADLLKNSLHDLTLQGPVISDGPDLAVVNASSPSLRWLLRDVQKISFPTQLSRDASPALVISAGQAGQQGQEDLALAAMYRGQDFTLTESIDWELLKPADWFRWMVFRRLPADALLQERVILWARSDFFPGGIPAVSNGAVPPAEETPR